MDLYIFCVVLGAAGMAAMAFLGFTSSHGGGHHSHDTSGHGMHGIGAGHGHGICAAHGIAHRRRTRPRCVARWQPRARPRQHTCARARRRMEGQSLVVALSTRDVQFPRRLRRHWPDRGATVGPVLAFPIAIAGWSRVRSPGRSADLQFSLPLRVWSRADARIGAHVRGPRRDGLQCQGAMD